MRGAKNLRLLTCRNSEQKESQRCVDETPESESHVEIGKEMKTFSASRYV